MARQRKRSVHGSGSVYQRQSDGRWVAKFKLEETGKYKELYASSEREANEKLQEALFQQKQGTLAIGRQQTVKQFLEYWLEDVYKASVRLNTYVNCRVIVHKHLVPGLGHIKLQKLTAQQIQAFYAKKLRSGASASRVKAMHAALHRALEHARRIKLVGTNVSADVDLPRQEQPQIHPLTLEQVQLLLQKVKEHRLEALLVLALATGMRKGEILSLRWSDVDLEKGMLRVCRTLNYMAQYGFVEGEPKTQGSRRTILLPRFVIDILRRHRADQLESRLMAGVQWVDHDLVFCNKKGGFIVHTTLLYHFSRLLNEAGLPHVRFHDLRHSAATLLLSMGVPVKVVQELLGHSKISMTLNTYTHVLPSMQKEAVDKMEGFLRQQP